MKIDAVQLKKMFLTAASELDAKKEWINELNVFPVPDGDTGTNMTMTIMSAAREVAAIQDVTMEAVAKAISSGALRGARGNSGVILSQLLRGFVRSVGNEDLDVPVIVKAAEKAVETAYKAVMKPKEGTILTVAKAMAEKAAELADETDLQVFMEKVIEAGDDMLQKTPELLPVLKQAGVVDSGGQGLMVLMHGAYAAFLGKEADLSVPEFTAPAINRENITIDTSELDTSDIVFGYCTEFIILLEKEFTEEDEDQMKEFLTGIGDSLVCVADEGVVKIHVHTNDPGLAIQKALTYGQLSRIKIDNMREEHQERLFKDAEKLAAAQAAETAEKKQAKERGPKKETAFVSVCAGDGLTQIFKDLGVDVVISGGQTMNPSTDDILSAIEEANAETVFVLPNNGNIVLAAQQAASLSEDCNVVVIPTGTVPQGISCMVNYLPGGAVEENEEAMKEGMSLVQTIDVTYAVRDTMIDDVEIHKDDYMALSAKSVLAAGKELSEIVKEAVSRAVTDESVLVSLYYGEDVTEEEANLLAEELSEIACDADVEVNYGGQPVYYYLISIE